MCQRLHAFAIILAAALGGTVGAWAYGLLGGSSPIEGLPPIRMGIQLGSLGGFWGALAASMLWACAARQSALRAADALVPGLLLGGAVARISCLLEGCCPGIQIGDGTYWFQPLYLWPLYDIAALLATLLAVSLLAKSMRFNLPGLSVGTSLALYGCLRFLIEFLRLAHGRWPPYVGAGVVCVKPI